MAVSAGEDVLQAARNGYNQAMAKARSMSIFIP
jgi:hypothetical protein